MPTHDSVICYCQVKRVVMQCLSTHHYVEACTKRGVCKRLYIHLEDYMLPPIKLRIACLTLTVHSPTKSNKGKWRKCAKSDYVIEAGLIWEQNRCPGSDTQVACHGCTVHLVREGPSSKPRWGTPIFGSLPFRWDSLETKKGAWELRLISSFTHYVQKEDLPQASLVFSTLLFPRFVICPRFVLWVFILWPCFDVFGECFHHAHTRCIMNSTM